LANLSVAKSEDDLAYKNLDDDAKFNLGGANAAYGGAMAGSIAAGAGAGAGIGALVGTVFPVIGNAVGAAVGAGIGAIGGLIGGFFTGEAAKDAAFEDTQRITEALAKAIADGAITDTGSGYKVQDAEKLAKYGVDANKLDEYYAEVGDSTEALRSFGD
jgi:phage tail tape-measure protein